MRRWVAMAAASGLILGASGSAEAGCTRSIVNRTPYLVTVSQDGGPAVTVGERRSRPIRYEAGGTVTVSVYCPTGAGRYADMAVEPAFSARYETKAVLDRCFVEIGRGGTQPLALNDPRQGDIVVAPYGVSCPLPARGPVLSARY